MSARPFRRSFAGGEITEELFGRVDLSKGQIGLKTCRNFRVKPQGPVENRPGFKYINETKFNDRTSRLIEFAIDANTTMALEFGDLYIRFFRNGAPITESSKAIVAATQANPGVFQINAHGYSTGDWLNVFVNHWDLPGNYFVVQVTDANHFTLKTLAGVAVNTSAFSAFTDGTVARVYEVVSPYSHADVKDIHYAQSSDAMTLVHPSYAPRELKRTSDTNWSLTTPTFIPSVLAPTGVAAVAGGGGGATTYSYVVTSISADGLEESQASTPPASCNNDLTLAGHFNTVTWVAAIGASLYNVYKNSNGLYGFIGQAANASFVDDNIEPDISQTPPNISNPFNAVGEYPSAVTYFEQRRCFGGSVNRPQNIWMTKAGTESNLAYSIPTRDDDSIRAKVYSRLKSSIRHLVPLSDLLVLSSGIEFRMTTQNSDAVTPSTISFKADDYEGANNVQPITANASIIYSQARGGHLLQLAFSFNNSGYRAIDICVLAPHLFDGYTIVDLAYNKAPTKYVWAVRSDGLLVGLTYLPDQEVLAFHHHDTAGLFRSVCNVSEDIEDCLYAITERTINSRTVKFIEKSMPRKLGNSVFTANAGFFVDAGLVVTNAVSIGTTITGLWHLEGQTVSIMLDNGVHPSRVVTNGRVTLDNTGLTAVIGLGYLSDLETMPLVMATQDGSYRQGSQANINGVYLRLVNSSGIFAGPSFDKLKELKQRTTEPMGTAPNYLNGIQKLDLTPGWDYDATLCVRQSNPLPVTITSMTLDVALGG
jgi:hypothetical protein